MAFGGKHPNAKLWNDAGVFEIVGDHYDETFQALYTGRFREVAYVLLALLKKSPKGIKTAEVDVDLVNPHLNLAQKDYETRYGTSK